MSIAEMGRGGVRVRRGVGRVRRTGGEREAADEYDEFKSLTCHIPCWNTWYMTE